MLPLTLLMVVESTSVSVVRLNDLQRDRGGAERLRQEVGPVGGGIGHHQRRIEERRCQEETRDGPRFQIDDLAVVRILSSKDDESTSSSRKTATTGSHSSGMRSAGATSMSSGKKGPKSGSSPSYSGRK